MVNTNLNYEGDWVLDGYMERNGVSNPVSGTAKGTVDGDVVTLEFDMTLQIGGNDMPFKVTTTLQEFDEETQGFSVHEATPFGTYEGAGKVFPDFNIGWRTMETQGITEHMVTLFLGENEIKQFGSTFDAAGTYSGASMFHYIRA
ncbi:MAG TPA: hypothetical protein VKM55_15980 [Candidatus Lokiarchaeia archaeon]|nr:hypothetical protein [Candidatus Lokiarchaeia archaeon]